MTVGTGLPSGLFRETDKMQKQNFFPKLKCTSPGGDPPSAWLQLSSAQRRRLGRLTLSQANIVECSGGKVRGQCVKSRRTEDFPSTSRLLVSDCERVKAKKPTIPPQKRRDNIHYPSQVPRAALARMEGSCVCRRHSLLRWKWR